MAKKGGKMHKVMGEFKRGQLRSGSKKGPKVKDRKQAIAIGLSEAARSEGKRVGKKLKTGISKAEKRLQGQGV